MIWNFDNISFNIAFATGHCHRFADFDDILAPKRNSRTPAVVWCMSVFMHFNNFLALIRPYLSCALHRLDSAIALTLWTPLWAQKPKWFNEWSIGTWTLSVSLFISKISRWKTFKMIQNMALRTYIWFPMRNESLHSSTRVDGNALHK